MDIIGKISPASANLHAWILVATDYFTKWVEAESYESVTSAEVIKFIEEKIVHRFGIPEVIMADNGPVFVSQAIENYSLGRGIRIVHSTPYYPQSNGQAEASNKVIKGILQKMVADRPDRWHEKLSDTLWAYRTSRRSATGTTPFALTYGHDAVLPMEVQIRSLRVQQQFAIDSPEYTQAMLQDLEDLDSVRLDAYELLQAQKQIAIRAYNQRVKYKGFAEGEMVWKSVLPIGLKDPRYGKWSPNWEGPFIIEKVLGKGAYQLMDLNGDMHERPINGQYLKKYYPSVWEMRETEEALHVGNATSSTLDIASA